MKKKTHRLPKTVEYDIKTGESRVIQYVELTEKEYQDQIVKPLAEILYPILMEELESGAPDHDETHEK